MLTGDACGLGETRKRELVKACRVLGVKEVRALVNLSVKYRHTATYIQYTYTRYLQYSVLQQYSSTGSFYGEAWSGS